MYSLRSISTSSAVQIRGLPQRAGVLWNELLATQLIAVTVGKSTVQIKTRQGISLFFSLSLQCKHVAV